MGSLWSFSYSYVIIVCSYLSPSPVFSSISPDPLWLLPLSTVFDLETPPHPPLALWILKVSSVHVLLCAFSFHHLFYFISYSNDPPFNVSVFPIPTYVAFFLLTFLLFLTALRADCWLRCVLLSVCLLSVLFYYLLFLSLQWGLHYDLFSSLLSCSLLGYACGETGSHSIAYFSLELTMYPRLVSNSKQSSCLSLCSAELLIFTLSQFPWPFFQKDA